MDGRIGLDTSGEVSTVTKRAEGTGPRSRLAHEAAVLETIAHPGVVRLVEYRSGDEWDELITEFSGAVTLADHRPSDLAAVAGLGAAIADTVADLHEMGLAHGCLQPDHVVLGARRRPVLCSFSQASYDQEALLGDVVALGQLVSELLDCVPQARGGAERRVRNAIAEAASDAAEGRGTARTLARSLAGVPGAHIAADGPAEAIEGGEDAPELDGTRTWRHRVVSAGEAAAPPSRRNLVAVGLVVLAVVVVLVAAWTQRRNGDLEERLLGLATPTAAPTPTPEPALTPPPAGCPAGPDVDGDGCGDDTEVIGRLIRHGDRWYEVGEPGDVVVLGHWSCAPVATPAVLRPATGELFVFDRWPSADSPVSVVSSTTVDQSATSLVIGTIDGCDAPMVEPS